MKLLFIDHAFHMSTKSSAFFLELLRKRFQVKVVYVDPLKYGEVTSVLNEREYEYAVLWQLDFLAPAFIAAGFRTTVVPMYDGSANMPREHWIAMNRTSIVCFSHTLRHKIIDSGAKTYLCKYYPPLLKKDITVKSNSKYSVFLWLRCPEEINVGTVEILLGDQISSLHIHNAPDSVEKYVLHGISKNYPITMSYWKKGREEYLEYLKRADIFIAPRAAEGIGMAMLEAMAMGKLIVAHDDATNNEYISNWLTGILFDFRNPSYFNLSPLDAADIVRCSVNSVKLGYKKWSDSEDSLLNFIQNTENIVDIKALDISAMVSELILAYQVGGEYYGAFLEINIIKKFPEIVNLNGEINNIPKLIGFKGLPLMSIEGFAFGGSANSINSTTGLTAISATSSLCSTRNPSFAFSVLDYGGISLYYELENSKGVAFDLLIFCNGSIVSSRSSLDLRMKGKIEINLNSTTREVNINIHIHLPEPNLDMNSSGIMLVLTGLSYLKIPLEDNLCV